MAPRLTDSPPEVPAPFGKKLGELAAEQLGREGPNRGRYRAGRHFRFVGSDRLAGTPVV